MERVRIRSAMAIVVFAIILFSIPKKIASLPIQKPLSCGSIPIQQDNVEYVEDPKDPENGGHRSSRARNRERNNSRSRDGESHNGSHSRQHRRKRARKHHRHYHLSQNEMDCCRWMKEMDDACVCQLLYRMPSFMRKPKHDYVVRVHDSCTVTLN
ncbi:hypothetical protein MKW98_023718 [Papaver atlanticum]|uniref:Uncharacterized protein n=1 Tax=Papaver atlanticum TaxID=357466 RepID=A0AAD4XP00_9MAGN|nr:hypothetical protein MKW98_023718 [Papaver atlanticum]